MSNTDLQLLARYARDHTEAAFAELVRRHVNLVHSAALRQVRSPQLAEEVAQSVFTDLAHNAHRLACGGDASSPKDGSDAPSLGSLTPWLYQVTRRTAIDVVRREARRQLREQIATEMNAMNATLSRHNEMTADANDWTHIEPLLDEAMSALDDTDRATILLRYFENKSLREVGASLGTSDDAAQKRVSRAVERLREFFVKRGVTVGTSGLVVLISAHAVQAAPVGLAVTISTAAAFAGTTLATTATATAVKTIAMTTLHKTVITATLAVAVGTGIYEAHRASVLNGQVQSLQQQLSPLAAQLEALQSEQREANIRLAALQQENQLLRRNTPELVRLRAEVNRLRAELLASMENAPTASEAMSWLARVNELKQKLETMSELKIPELELLSERDWLNVARDVDLKNDGSVRRAFTQLRKVAKEKFAPMLSAALRRYARANNDRLPADISALQPYFASPINAEILARYEFMQTGSLNWEEPAIAEKSPADAQMDIVFKIGANGTWWSSVSISGGAGGESGKTTWSTNDTPLWLGQLAQLRDSAPKRTQRDESELERILERPFQEYLQSLNGQEPPEDPTAILPYLKTQAERAAWQKVLQNEAEDQKELEAIDAHHNDYEKVNQAINAFLRANKKFPESPSELTSYFKTPGEQAALDRLLERIGRK